MKVVCYKKPPTKDVYVDMGGKERWWGGPALIIGDSYTVLNSPEYGEFYILKEDNKMSTNFWGYRKEIFMTEFDWHMKQILEEE